MPDESSPSLSEDAARALACVLDTLVPPSGDGRLPGAGELGLVTAIEAAMRDTPDLRPAVVQGLAALAQIASEQQRSGFHELSEAERRRALDRSASSQPAFLPGLIFHTYVNYYQHDRVVEALGMEPRPPHPLGYELETGDFSLLENVRRRGPLYREEEGGDGP